MRCKQQRPINFIKKSGLGIASFILSTFLISGGYAQTQTILNVSYDPTREMYRAYNDLFANYWLNTTGTKVRITMSHGGSGAQARAVIDGLQADVVTLALSYDIDIIAEKTNLIPVGWQKRLTHQSAPYVSTIVFLVRQGNPKNIRDWNDLIRPGVSVITPNPKTSGVARWNYLAAWGYALLQPDGSDEKAKSFIGKLFANVPILDTGARDATNTFIQRGIGDVLVTWENEALLALQRLGKNQYEVVIPSMSILAEPTVALVDGNVDRKGTRAVAQAYLEYLYSPEAQELLAQHYYRPTLESVAKKHQNRFPNLQLFTIDQIFGGWHKATYQHFVEGGIFDQLYTPQKRK
ncbi:MAG TPA: sulfate ABC transporter substrate-binding protein [Alphaproteobacteria bacterium]|nr:sulfate ABC transporter substrate-binding protein [Alphaproteobacteria bacterium]